MIVAWNTYIHQMDETSVVISLLPRYNALGRKQGTVERWRLKGMVFGDTVANVTAAANTIEAAYGDNGGNLLLLDNNGILIHRSLLSNGSIGGVRMIRFDFPVGEGAEWTTYRNYEIEAEAEYPESGGEILDWRESVTTGGGKPRWVIKEPLKGKPIRQQTHERTKYFARQSGMAVGLSDYPDPPAPLWPDDLHEDREPLTKESPRTIGIGVGQYRTEYIIHWDYEFESIEPLNGSPTEAPVGN